MKNRFRPDGSCSACSGGWLCKACQNDNARSYGEQADMFRRVAAYSRSERVARVCARYELESDEGGSREEKAAAMLERNPGLAP